MPPKIPDIPDFDWRTLAKAKFELDRLRALAQLHSTAKMVATSWEPECPATAQEVCEKFSEWYTLYFDPWAEWVTMQLGGGPGTTPPPPPPPFK